MEGGQEEAGAPAQGAQQANIIRNETPVVLVSALSTVTSLIETYGWLLLISFFALMYLYQKYKPSYEKWKQEQEDLKEEEIRKKDPDALFSVQLSMEESRHRLQQKASADAEAKRIRDAEIAEKKRLEKIEEWEKHKQGKGYHSKQKGKQEEYSDVTAKQLKPKRKNDFRPAYNPLSGGGGGSSGYRPSGRGGSSGG